MQDLPQEAFDEIRTSLIAKKLSKENDLLQETGKHWNEIEAKAYMFGRKHEVAKELEAITKDELLAFYDAHFAPGNRRTLVVMTHSTTHPINPDPESVITVSDVHSFHSSMSLHPAAARDSQTRLAHHQQLCASRNESATSTDAAPAAAPVYVAGVEYQSPKSSN